MPHATRNSNAASWFMWSLVAFGYSVAFLQRVSLQTVVDLLMRDLHVGASGIGIVAAGYFYGYVAMQLPAGVIVDRWGVRNSVLLSLLISGIATFLFSSAATVTAVMVTRILIGVGDVLLFGALIKLVSDRFPPERFGFMASLSQVSGYVGGMVATAPLALVATRLGWRYTFSLVGSGIVANLVACVFFLRPGSSQGQAAVSPLAYALRSLSALGRLKTWGPIVTWAGAYVVSWSLLGVWGLALLMQAYHLDRSVASAHIFFFIASYTVGALASGFLSDSHFRTLRRPLVAAALLRTMLLVAITPAIGAYLSAATISFTLLALGGVSGAITPLVLSSLKLTFHNTGIATGLAINATIANLTNGLTQPLLGYILDSFWDGAVADGVRQYRPEAYTALLSALALISMLSAIGPFISVDKRDAIQGEQATTVA